MAETSVTKQPGILSSLDKLIGNDGLKTDIRVALSKDTYFYLGASIVISLGIVITLYSISKAILKK